MRLNDAELQAVFCSKKPRVRDWSSVEACCVPRDRHQKQSTRIKEKSASKEPVICALYGIATQIHRNAYRNAKRHPEQVSGEVHCLVPISRYEEVPCATYYKQRKTTKKDEKKRQSESFRQCS